MISQLLADGVLTGLSWALVASALLLVERTTGQINLFLGGVLAAGTVVGAIAASRWNLGVGIGAALVCGAVLALGAEWLVFRPLRRDQAPGVATLLASVAAYFLVESVLGLLLGPGRRPFETGHGGVVRIGAVSVSGIRLGTGVIGILCIAAAQGVLAHTRLGVRLRALASNGQLAQVRGLPVDLLAGGSQCFAGGLAALAGLLLAADTGVAPDMGLSPIVYGLAIVVLGGRGRTLGLIGAAIGLGCVRSLSVLLLPGTWTEAAVFTVLFGVLACTALARREETWEEPV